VVLLSDGKLPASCDSKNAMEPRGFPPSGG
jgi:hypothetical protein